MTKRLTGPDKSRPSLPTFSLNSTGVSSAAATPGELPRNRGDSSASPRRRGARPPHAAERTQADRRRLHQRGRNVQARRAVVCGRLAHHRPTGNLHTPQPARSEGALPRPSTERFCAKTSALLTISKGVEPETVGLPVNEGVRIFLQ